MNSVFRSARHRRERAPESDPSGLYAIDAKQQRADGVNRARLLRCSSFKDAESRTTRAGEIDFEEFLLVIKNMQNPGADSA